MKRRHKRIAFILVGVAGLAIAAALVLSAFQNNLVFFFSPTQVAARQAPTNRTFRIGGLVETNSLKRDNDGLTVHFTVTDTATTIPVVYKGILPDLFKEGRGCVARLWWISKPIGSLYLVLCTLFLVLCSWCFNAGWSQRNLLQTLKVQSTKYKVQSTGYSSTKARHRLP